MFELILGEAGKSQCGSGLRAPDAVLIADVMTRSCPIVPAHISVGAARKIAELKSATVLIVEDKGCLVGSLDSRVLRTADPNWRVADCLKPLRVCLSPTTTLVRARELMIEHNVTSFPVAAGPFLVGSISRATVEQSLASRAHFDGQARAAA